ncbi:RidA family protein [Thauera chlorobenzoica]|uniref:Uncharacterized protein n=1 Tax=Thauera chlorobenzoica TaxID=96773 RepID=A0A1H5YFF2_9RHOO|nr:RidA family protein [Thauera chlorobenzoica]APR05927.1 hypothetical protein Tchl_3114 [Thauera chlorobenzoica]SEG22380.1 Enamine deaminase RidA, house cleaning of reactive enamine intermediates, YjgF/YER057c/UK114 family [Thauera chlorobenzoica]
MTILRKQTSPRMSQVVVHGDTVYLAGQVPDDFTAPVAEQTRQVLSRIDRLLGEVGSERSKILSAQVWLADIGDFDAMNEIWEAWVDHDSPPARATCAVVLAHPAIRVEVIVVAAL